MAIGKDSLSRAAKTAGKKAEEVKPETLQDTAKAAKKPVKKTAANKKDTAEKAAVKEAAPQEITHHIVYQPSAEVLERAANPNESFGIGDAMPIYYL